MSQRIAIGIDLGTSTSEICMYKQNGEPIPIPDPISKSPIIPSFVAIDKKDRILVGEAARPYIDIPGRGVREVKRKMGTSECVSLGSQQYRPEEISAILLKYLKTFAENHIGQSISDIVLTVPANFDDLQRKATQAAAAMAGLNVIRLINEPTAAALAFGVSQTGAEGQVIVIDFGGGTLDITVLDMMDGVLDVKTTYGDTQLGGKDIDKTLAELVLSKFQKENQHATISEQAREKLKSESERAKVALSSSDSTNIQILGFAVKNGRAIDLDIEIQRVDFERAMSPIIERTRICIEKALSAKNIDAISVDKILLVGGSSYIPCIRNLVRTIFNKESVHGVSPDLAIAIGAATQAAITSDIVGSQNVIIADVCSHGFGVDCVSVIGDQLMVVYDQLIPPNTTIPYTVSREYSLVSPDQREVEITLYQDHDGCARLPEHCKKMTGGVITDIPPSLYGEPHPIKVDFSYNIDGAIVMEARIPGINKSCTIKFHPSKSGMDENAIAQGSNRISSTIIENSFLERFEPLIKRAEEKKHSAAPSEAMKIESTLDQLKGAIRENDLPAATRLSECLTDLLFEIDQA